MAVDHYENFPVASVLLPSHLRRPVAIIYRFAREADDLADEGSAPSKVRLQQLEHFRAQLQRLERREAPEIPWFLELASVIDEHELPFQPFYDLLSAFSQDVVKVRYADFVEVLDYCRRSADPVGRLLLSLYRSAGPQHLQWSDAICSSLQLINFLQDVAIDQLKDRIYLPQDDLARFGVSEAQIAAGDMGGGWRGLMGFELDRARALLNSGRPLGRALPGRIGLELRMIIAGGTRILEKIEAVEFDVFRRRPVLRPYDWPLMLWRSLR